MIKRYSEWDAQQPWISYTFGLTTDLWWPLWRSTRILGYARIECECFVCGDRTIVKIAVPRFGFIPECKNPPERVKYLEKHRHFLSIFDELT
jgi:hypothetical protein